MKRFFLSTFILSLAAFTTINAKVVRNYSSQSNGNLTFAVDSIDYRKDLTRVYGRLLGRPHTSNRIDGIVFMGTGISLTSTDIDGVDFRRYFQWEEDKTIPVEIDFPAMKSHKSARLIFDTPYGKSTTVVTVTNPDKHK